MRAVFFALIVTLLPQVSYSQCSTSDGIEWEYRASDNISNEMAGQRAVWLLVTASIMKAPGDPCYAFVQSEAWIWTLGGPTVIVDLVQAIATASAQGEFYGLWKGHARNWYVFRHLDQYDVWRMPGDTDVYKYLGAPPRTDEERCVEQGFDWECDSGLGCYCNRENCPILLNPQRSVYHLTSARSGVRFDINANGRRERVAWTNQSEEAGWLALDRNGNGLIDDGSELFGNATRKSDGTRAVDGFDALIDLDGGPTRSDGTIDASDEVYSRLRLWVDRNHNGVSEPDELSSLSEAGISAINLAYSKLGRKDGHGNRFEYFGTFLVKKRGVDIERVMVDVILATR
jgi:hypothetical protein